MLNSLKTLLWFCTAVSLSLGAVLLTLDHNRRYDEILDTLVPIIHTQTRSVAISETEYNPENSAFDLYSGLDILYGLRSWELEETEISIKGKVIPYVAEYGLSPAGPYDRDLGFALTLLDLNGDYRGVSLVDAYGRLAKLSFYLN